MITQDFTGLDLNKVASLQQKRTIAFVNHFVMTTVQFLNNFIKNCECKLMHFEHKLEKVEAAMVLLEARLSSIPEVNISKPEVQNSSTDEKKSTEIDREDSNKNNEDNCENVVSDEITAVGPEYERFLKMVQVGVPLNAVKLKMSLEGLDSNVLENLLKK